MIGSRKELCTSLTLVLSLQTRCFRTIHLNLQTLHEALIFVVVQDGRQKHFVEASA